MSKNQAVIAIYGIFMIGVIVIQSTSKAGN